MQDEKLADNMETTQNHPDWIRRLPKSDLHCHLDGSLRVSTLIDLARERGVALPSNTEEGLRELVFKDQYVDLPDYLNGFAYTCAVLTDAEALERAAYELGEDCLAEGVCYLEVRFAPQLHVREGLSVEGVLQAVTRGLERVQREHAMKPEVRRGEAPPFRFGLICCAMRMFTPAFSPWFADLIGVLSHWPSTKVFGVASLSLVRSVVDARDRLGLPVVGFDLAGAEAGHPASDHEEAYRFALKKFLKRTVHAGEAYGPESIFQGITRLHADRVGHGTSLYSSEQVRGSKDPERFVRMLSEYIADRRILLEVCVTSNLQTMPHLSSVSDHPVGRMIRDKLSVSLCTDNRLMSRTTVTNELVKVKDAFDLTPSELRNLVIHGFKRSFFPGNYKEKRQYVRQVMDLYDEVIRTHAPGSRAP